MVVSVEVAEDITVVVCVGVVTAGGKLTVSLFLSQTVSPYTLRISMLHTTYGTWAKTFSLRSSNRVTFSSAAPSSVEGSNFVTL